MEATHTLRLRVPVMLPMSEASTIPKPGHVTCLRPLGSLCLDFCLGG